jgi:hypothetical protein
VFNLTYRFNLLKMRFRIRALLGITSATAQVATTPLVPMIIQGNSNHLVRIVGGCVPGHGHLDFGDFTILSARPANF